jgi:hypothetical protein
MKKPPFLSNPNYCKKLFLPFKKKINKAAKKILYVKAKRLGGFLNKSYHIKYSVLIEKSNLKKETIYFHALSSPDPTRLQSFKVMDYLWKRNFSSGKYLIPQPLAFIKTHSMVITREIKGISFLEILKGGSKSEILKGIKESAKWLKKLHQTKPYNFKDVFLQFGPIYWKEQLRILKKGFPKKVSFLKDLIEKILNWEKENQKNPQRKITHHDFHPKNIFLGKRKIWVLDFSESRLSKPQIDVISFLCQIDFINRERIKRFSQKEIQKFSRFFLQEYFGKNWKKKLKEPDFRKDFLLLKKRIALQALVGNLLFGKKPKIFTDVIFDNARNPFAQAVRL